MRNKYLSKIFTIILMIIISFILIFFVKRSSKSYASYEDTDFYFDTFVTITITDNSISYNEKQKLVKEVFDKCKQYEEIFSSTLVEGELYTINSSNDSSFTISKDLHNIIEESLNIYALTNGSFDIRLGSICSLWDFKQAHIPDEAVILNELDNIRNSEILLNDNKLLFKNTNIKPDLNLGGIAKGYISDRIKEYLVSKGVKNAIINLGGNILLIGGKKSSSGNDDFYNIGITLPFTTSGEAIAYVKAKDISIVTSGIYERYFKEDNTIYHHIIDPSNGYPVKNNLYSVTIIASDSTTADALSTSIFVLGLDEGMKLINSIDDVYAVFVTDTNEVIVSEGLSINDKEIQIIKN